MPDIFSLWQQERELLKPIELEHPGWFQKEAASDPHAALRSIGIALPREDLPLGYLRYYPFDFIVEEIGMDGRLSTVEYETPSSPTITQREAQEELRTVYADMVKVGISTIDAQKELARLLGADPASIGIAGIKDANAVTSQRVSIRNVPLDQCLALEPTNIFLKHIEQGKGALQTGDLKGNRFIILVRTNETMTQHTCDELLAQAHEKGFWNFYWLQRFGNRLLSHWWGLLLFRGEYEQVVQSFCCDNGSRDLPYFCSVRDNARQAFGNWSEMAHIFEQLPYTMRHELIVVNHLRDHPDDYIGALLLIIEQVKLWIYAYASYVFNRKLSHVVPLGSGAPDELPLVLSMNKEDREPYAEFLASDGVPERFELPLRAFPMVRLMHRTVTTRINMTIHKTAVCSEGAAILFDLSKGSYATTFLAHLFTLTGGLPVPEWVKTTDVDAKELLGLGSLAATKKILEPYIVRKKEEENEV